jgi:hypothetical protein
MLAPHTIPVLFDDFWTFIEVFLRLPRYFFFRVSFLFNFKLALTITLPVFHYSLNLVFVFFVFFVFTKRCWLFLGIISELDLT